MGQNSGVRYLVTWIISTEGAPRRPMTYDELRQKNKTEGQKGKKIEENTAERIFSAKFSTTLTKNHFGKNTLPKRATNFNFEPTIRELKSDIFYWDQV